MAHDIHKLTDSPAASAAELRRRWGVMLSYRYVGRSYVQMDELMAVAITPTSSETLAP